MRIEREAAIGLRRQGRTYGEIQKILNTKIPKSTLSIWFREVSLTKNQQLRIARRQRAIIKNAQRLAVSSRKEKRAQKLKAFEKSAKHFRRYLHNKQVAKLILATLYLGEGAKTNRGSLMFGNSDPEIIKLFLSLFRFVFPVDDRKFRCTLQGRADQNIKFLERFWSGTTGIPLRQFYKARIDPRTINKHSRKQDYKGVCRIDYFSADIYNELKIIGHTIASGR